MAPTGSHPEMWLDEGEYSFQCHHMSHRAVGVPGTVNGLYLAWEEHGSLPWKRLVRPAIALAREGFVVTHGLSRSLKRMEKYPASMAQFSKNGAPYAQGVIGYKAPRIPCQSGAAHRAPDLGATPEARVRNRHLAVPTLWWNAARHRIVL